MTMLLQINRKKNAKSTLNKNNKAFIIHVTFLSPS